MTFLELYQAVRDYMAANSLTVQQLYNTEGRKASELLGLTGDDASRLMGWWPAIRTHVKRNVKRERELAELNQLKSTATTWLSNNFPDAEWERNDDVITIYLNGRD